MGRSPSESKKKAGHPPKVKPGCLTCKARRIKCDETRPTCQRCQQSRQACKGLWGKTSTSPQTRAPSNTSPAANTRSMTVTQCGRSSAEAEPPINSSDPENRQGMEPTWVEKSTDTVREHILLEPGLASTASGSERGQEQSFIWSEEPKGQKEKNIQRTLMVGMDHSKLSSNTSQQTASEDDLADSAKLEGSETSRARKRTADAMLLPEARTTAKRARSRKGEQQHGDCIVVSWESMDDHSQATRDGEHPDRSPASETARLTSQSDGADCQSNRQVSNEDSNTTQKARLALLAVEASSQENTPPDSRIESDSASTHSPKFNSRPLEIAEVDNTGLSDQARDPPNDFQPPSAPVSSSSDSQGPSGLHVPAGSERQSSVSAPVETEQDSGRSLKSHRVDTQSSAVETERRRSISGPFGASPTSGTGQSASFDSLQRPPDSTHRPEAFNNNELRTTFRSSDPTSLQSMAQHNRPTGSRASPHTPNQASMQGAGSRQFQPQMITTYPARGNRPSHSLNASHLESEDNPTGSETVSISSSNATTSAAHQRQAPPHSQASSYRPALTFTTDLCLRRDLSLTTIQPYIERFERDGRVHLGPTKIYPVGVIMWPEKPDVHGWYMAETGTTDVSTLRIELYDAEWRLEKISFISRGNAHDLPELRQYIWDSFWNHQSTFKVAVRAVHPFPHDLPGAEAPRARNIGVGADSRPPAAMTSPVHDGYPSYHNEVTAHKFPPIAPAPAPQMQIPAVKYLGPSMDISSLTQGTSTSMDVAAYVPRQHEPEGARRPSSRQTTIAAFVAPEIAIRVQKDGAGKVSNPYSKWVLGPEITTTDFFAWFAHQTGRGGSEGPPSLRFTLKDAMPAPTSSTIAQANEDHFNLMKKDLRTQFEKAKDFVPNLKEFLVVVTDPGWISEEEHW